MGKKITYPDCFCFPNFFINVYKYFYYFWLFFSCTIKLHSNDLEINKEIIHGRFNILLGRFLLFFFYFRQFSY